MRCSDRLCARLLSLVPLIGFACGSGCGSSQPRLNNIERRLVEVQQEVKQVLQKLKSDEDEMVEELQTGQAVHVVSVAEALTTIERLGPNPAAGKLAEALMNLDALSIKPAEEEQFKRYKLDQQIRLRQLVKSEVLAHQKAALDAPSGTEGVKEHGEAGHVLVLYPMADDAIVVREASELAASQAETLARLEVIRRQRYNRWATEQIEKALNYYNANVSRFNPFDDNALLITNLVQTLGEVDPVILEPAVLELYNHIIERTKNSLSEKNKLELAKRLTGPAIRRKILGDF